MTKEGKQIEDTEVAQTNNEKLVTLKENDITVRFDLIFGTDDISHLNVYQIKKRKFYKVLPIVVRDMEYIIHNYEEISPLLLNIRIKTYDDTKYTDDEFIKDVEGIYKNDEIQSIIEDYIDSTYSISLVSNIPKKINTDLQITDKINKLLLRSAMMIRIVLPIICDYTRAYDIESERLFTQIFKDIIKYTSGNSDVVLNKLNKIISSRIYQTRYSDIVIWNYLKNMSIDMNLLIVEIYNTIIKAIICKIEPNTSTINFLDVVIKNKIDFKFTYNYPIYFKSIKIDQSDDEIDEKDKMEIMIFVSNTDDGEYLINKATVNKICDKGCFTKAEINEFKEKYLNNNYMNEVQKYVLKLYYNSTFQFKIATEEQRVILLMIMIKELECQGFVLLNQMMKARILDTNVYTSPRKISTKVLRSNEFKKLSKKYLLVQDVFMKDNSLSNLTSFKNYEYELDGKRLEIDYESYCYECTKFLNLI